MSFKKDRIMLVLATIVLVMVLLIGYLMNVYKLVQCDFEAPYKAEVIRGVGMFIPFGAFIGYIDINDSKFRKINTQKGE